MSIVLTIDDEQGLHNSLRSLVIYAGGLINCQTAEEVPGPLVAALGEKLGRCVFTLIDHLDNDSLSEDIAEGYEDFHSIKEWIERDEDLFN